MASPKQHNWRDFPGPKVIGDDSECLDCGTVRFRAKDSRKKEYYGYRTRAGSESRKAPVCNPKGYQGRRD